MNSQIAPSILAADFACLGDEVEAVLDAGADLIHFDVMDNHFVPNLTVGAMVLEALHKRFPNAIFDAHLMVTPVERLVEEFLSAGASMISVHPEACQDIPAVLKCIRASSAKAGLVLNPSTSEEVIEPYLDQLDYVLVMSVNPGFGGQAFIPEVLPKLTRLQKTIEQRGLTIQLEIDGGIGKTTIRDAARSGAEIFVAGSAIFGSSDYQSTISELRELAS